MKGKGEGEGERGRGVEMRVGVMGQWTRVAS